MPSIAARPDFREDIQGLRAIAVLAVMVFHANGAWLPGGFIGVDMFFVISGFIVSRIILDRKGAFDWRGFYLGRLKRIVPAYLATLAVVALAAAVLLIPQDFGFFRSSLKSALIFNSNNYFAGFGDYFAPSSHELPLLHTWSLAIEMQFYLVLPLLLAWLPRAALRYGLPLFIAAVIAWTEYRMAQQASMYFSFVARSAEFGFGIWLAAMGPSFRLSGLTAEIASIGGAVLLALGLALTPEAAFPGVWVLLPCLGVLLIMAARDSGLNRLISCRWMVAVGAISYSLYLWHWPVLAFMRYYTQQYQLGVSWLAAYAVAAFALAALSYHYVETPFRRMKKGGKALGGISAAALVFAGLLAGGKALNAGVVEALPVERTRYADAEKICHGQVVGECLHGVAGNKPAVLVIGDSHAAQLNLAFDELGVVQNRAFQVVTGSSCVPIAGFDVERLPGWARKACADQIAYAQPLIASADVVVLAGMWQYQAESPAFMRALDDFLSGMHARDVRVIVLGQAPMLDSNVIRMHRFAELGLPRRQAHSVPTAGSDERVKKLVARYGNAAFVDVSGFGLFKTLPFHDGELIYMDSHHLNEAGARLYAQEFGKIFLGLTREKEHE